MAYDPRIPLMFQYQRAQQDPRTLQQIYGGALQNQNAQQNMDIQGAQEQRQATSFGQLNPIQALIAAQVQKEVAAPPPMYRQAQPQQPAPVQDRYSPIEQGIQQDEEMLRQRQGNLAASSYNPSNPLGFIAERDKNMQDLSDQEKGIQGRRMEVGANRDWDALVPELEAITQPAVAAMKTQNRDQSIDTINGTIAALQGAVVKKNPNLLQNKNFIEYIQRLEKMRAAPMEPSPYRSDIMGFQRERFENEKSQKMLDRVAKYRNETEKDRDSGAQIKEVDSVLSKMGVKGGIFGNSNAVDIPGFGVGEKAFRKFAQSKEAVNLRATVSALMNAYRNGIFGASLTEGEQRAFEEFSGTGIMANQEALFSGLRNINRALDQRLRPESEDVAEALKGQGILTYRDLPKPQEKAVTKPSGKVSAYTDAEKEKRYQEWKKANGK